MQFDLLYVCSNGKPPRGGWCIWNYPLKQYNCKTEVTDFNNCTLVSYKLDNRCRLDHRRRSRSTPSTRAETWNLPVPTTPTGTWPFTTFNLGTGKLEGTPLVKKRWKNPGCRIGENLILSTPIWEKLQSRKKDR